MVVVFLESEEEELTDVCLVRDVLGLENDSQFAGAIHTERVDTDVEESLVGYELEEGELEKIQDAVKRVLMIKGIRFYGYE